jgi:hypothetical protein
MMDVWIPTVDQRWLILPRYTQPSPDTKLLIEKLRAKIIEVPEGIVILAAGKRGLAEYITSAYESR